MTDKQLPVEGVTAGENFDLFTVGCYGQSSGGGARPSDDEPHIQDFVTVAQEL